MSAGSEATLKFCSSCWKVVYPGMAVVMKRRPFSQHVIAGMTLDALPDCSEAREDLGYEPIGFRQGLASLPPYENA